MRSIDKRTCNCVSIVNLYASYDIATFLIAPMTRCANNCREQLRQLHDTALGWLFDRLYPKIKLGADKFKEMNYVIKNDSELQVSGSNYIQDFAPFELPS